MAIRQLRYEGDPLLRKRSREITAINQRIQDLLNDMVETMYEEHGVGLAAPQVGVLRRAIVIDIGQGIIKMINPIIKSLEGEIIGPEGCLSVPGFQGTVARPNKVVVGYMDESGNDKIMECNDFLARAVCHEIDHLNGILFIDKYIEEWKPSEDQSKGDDVDEL